MRPSSRGALDGPAPGLPKLNSYDRYNLGTFQVGERQRMIGSLRRLARIVQSDEMRQHVRAVIEYAEEMRT